MAKLTINRGSLANDGTGDNLRDGANKINLNFDEIYTAIGDGTVQLTVLLKLLMTVQQLLQFQQMVKH